MRIIWVSCFLSTNLILIVLEILTRLNDYANHVYVVTLIWTGLDVKIHQLSLVLGLVD